MNNIDTAFFRKIDKREHDLFSNSGNIQYHNEDINHNFDYLSCEDKTLEYSDDFYRILRKTVKKVDDPPILFIILFYVCSIGFFSAVALPGNLNSETFGFVVFSLLVFAIATALLTYRIVKKNRILKCVKQRENIYAVALNINGVRSFYDNSDDSSETKYYIYSEPNLIRVPKKISDNAAPDKKLICAVVDTGKKKYLYALYAI